MSDNPPRRKRNLIRLAIMTAGLSLFWMAFAPLINSGKEKFATPSASSFVARLSGVLVETGDVLSFVEHHNLEGMFIKEVWIEDVLEFYESIPIRKQLSGRRICIRIENIPQSVDPWNLNLTSCSDDQSRSFHTKMMNFGTSIVFAADLEQISLDGREVKLCINASETGLLAEMTLRFSKPPSAQQSD